MRLPWGVGEYASETLEFFSRAGIKNPYIIAHSFGARVAIKAAGEFDAPFRKVILTGAAGLILNRGFSYRVKVKTYRAVKRLFPAYAERHFGSEEYKNLSPVMRESYKKIVNEDLRETAKKVKMPILLIYGEKDDVTPVKAGEIYASLMPDARLEIISSAGHFAFLDDAVSFRQIAEEFLEE